jgi:Peptide-N-glycosidase F, C terminal
MNVRRALATSVLPFAAACSSSGAVGAPLSDGGDATDAGTQDDAASDAGVVTTVLFDRTRIGSRNGTGWPNVGRATTDLVFDGPFTKVTIVVDLESSCFPFEKWTADPPPMGQNWPPSCDAFDRNFNVLLDDPNGNDAASGPPAIEIAHAITPFGGPEHLEIDVTDLANGLPGRHDVAVDIAAYSDPTGQVTGSNNGWTVSAKMLATRGAPPRKVLAVVPLYAGVENAGDTPPVVPFTIPAGTTAARLEYRASGHGGGDVGLGCIGPAEEFCNHPHQVLVDGAVAEMVRTWRTDCDSLCTVTHGPRFDYCLQNPCGDMNSVVAPRANWCPGSMTPPSVWNDIPALVVAGDHTFSFSIMPILAGGNWQVSAVYLAFAAD